jgi:hypothetical protein
MFPGAELNPKFSDQLIGALIWIKKMFTET